MYSICKSIFDLIAYLPITKSLAVVLVFDLFSFSLEDALLNLLRKVVSTQISTV